MIHLIVQQIIDGSVEELDTNDTGGGSELVSEDVHESSHHAREKNYYDTCNWTTSDMESRNIKVFGLLRIWLGFITLHLLWLLLKWGFSYPQDSCFMLGRILPPYALIYINTLCSTCMHLSHSSINLGAFFLSLLMLALGLKNVNYYGNT